MNVVRAVNKVDIVELDIDLPEREVQDKMVEIIESFEEEHNITYPSHQHDLFVSSDT